MSYDDEAALVKASIVAGAVLLISSVIYCACRKYRPLSDEVMTIVFDAPPYPGGRTGVRPPQGLVAADEVPPPYTTLPRNPSAEPLGRAPGGPRSPSA